MSLNAARHIVICIPAYNEAKSIAAIVEKAKHFASKVIVCDDGSIDNTGEIARSAGATVIIHSSNKGYGSAIRSLFQAARKYDADVMVTLDSDGQHDAEQIPRLIQPILEDKADIVIGSRFLTDDDRGKVPVYRSIGIKTITKFTQVATYKNITDAQSGFRAYSRTALAKIDLAETGMAISAEILFRAKENNLILMEVPVTIRYDVEDASTHNPLQHGMAVISSVIKFISLRHPLAFYGIPGIALLIVAGFFITNALDLFSKTRFVSTNMIIISVGAALMGVVLLVAGVILNILVALLRDGLRK